MARAVIVQVDARWLRTGPRVVCNRISLVLPRRLDARLLHQSGKIAGCRFQTNAVKSIDERRHRNGYDRDADPDHDQQFEKTETTCKYRPRCMDHGSTASHVAIAARAFRRSDRYS